MSQVDFRHFVKAAVTGAAVTLLLTTAGCANSLTAGGLGGASVTRVDASELPGPDGQVGSEQHYSYRIGPYDKLIVDVLGIEQLSDRRVTADGDGAISLPVAGVVNLNNLTLAEAMERMTQQLRAGHVRNPRVAINLQESVSRFVTVDGEVEQPGNYPMIGDMTLMRGVAAAKGATDFAKLREVVIHRTVQGRQMVALYDLAAIRRGAYSDPVLYPNDVVVVGDSPSRRLLQQLVTVAPLFISPLIAILDNRR
ncbi:polysaccharide biosynthesis/export family protein [Sphingopyxis sp. SCN 67-31]|uniref:polysaccharide biosynthesis/export family protein n=1 Tax=Sphingopyxis sp. SCN 67-31 TaxID=1660142 RepID=UPI00257C5948|nr:polysaccharide biosynthesis/export family protein [Sphingopyxis sp. SCN 67-31]